MKILLAEDDANKCRKVADFIRGCLRDVVLLEAHSYQAALQTATANAIDLIVLDMSMPTYDVTSSDKGGRTKHYAGRDILRQLRRKQIATRVVVLTQFESFGKGAEAMTLSQLRESLAAEYRDNYLGTIFYKSSESGWTSELGEILRRVFPRGGEKSQ